MVVSRGERACWVQEDTMTRTAVTLFATLLTTLAACATDDPSIPTGGTVLGKPSPKTLDQAPTPYKAASAEVLPELPGMLLLRDDDRATLIVVAEDGSELCRVAYAAELALDADHVRDACGWLTHSAR